MQPIQDFFTGPLGTLIWNLLIALLILVVGYIVARILGSLTRRLLKRIQLDNRLVSWLSDPENPRDFKVENVVASIVFWLVGHAVRSGGFFRAPEPYRPRISYPILLR